jgi:hypothetical protein
MTCLQLRKVKEMLYASHLLVAASLLSLHPSSLTANYRGVMRTRRKREGETSWTYLLALCLLFAARFMTVLAACLATSA